MLVGFGRMTGREKETVTEGCQSKRDGW